jgi:putative tricarboxylic transport membrane protein
VKYADVFSGLFLLLLSLVGSVLAYHLGLGGIHKPGSGLIPFGTTTLLGLMSLGLIVKGLLRPGEVPENRSFRGIRFGTLILVVGGLIGYAIVFESLGFVLSNFLLLTLLLSTIGRRSWWVTLVASLLIVLGTYLVFVFWLGCQFPKGFIGI